MKSIFYYIRQAAIEPDSNRVISQKRYGELLGFDRSTVCLNEKAGHIPSLKFIYAVSQATGIPLDYIVKKVIGPYVFDSELKQCLNNEKMKQFFKKNHFDSISDKPKPKKVLITNETNIQITRMKFL